MQQACPCNGLCPLCHAVCVWECVGIVKRCCPPSCSWTTWNDRATANWSSSRYRPTYQPTSLPPPLGTFTYLALVDEGATCSASSCRAFVPFCLSLVGCLTAESNRSVPRPCHCSSRCNGMWWTAAVSCCFATESVGKAQHSAGVWVARSPAPCLSRAVPHLNLATRPLVVCRIWTSCRPPSARCGPPWRTYRLPHALLLCACLSLVDMECMRMHGHGLVHADVVRRVCVRTRVCCALHTWVLCVCLCMRCWRWSGRDVCMCDVCMRPQCLTI